MYYAIDLCQYYFLMLNYHCNTFQSELVQVHEQLSSSCCVTWALPTVTEGRAGKLLL